MSTIPAKPTSTRLLSLDALRGFDMFWILGADSIVHAVATLTPNCKFTQLLDDQMKHSDWAGYTAYDLIFPTFIFIVGVALVFSLSKQLAAANRGPALRKICIRSIILFLWGVIFSGGFAPPPSLLAGHPHAMGAAPSIVRDVRIMGVLQRIAISYFFAAILFCYFKPKTLALITAGILIAYWLCLAFIPVPGVRHASFDENQNWPNYFDAHYLPGRLYYKTYDPEGPLSAPPAVATCLLGVFAGLLLRNSKPGPYAKVAALLLAGAASLALGLLWDHPFPHLQWLCFPIIKKIWTSSYVLVAAGYASMLLGLFYLVIDVWKFRVWTAPFLWIGSNAITLYLVFEFVNLHALAARFIGGELGQKLFHSYANLAIQTLVLLFILLLARFLHKRQIFLRV